MNAVKMLRECFQRQSCGGFILTACLCGELKPLYQWQCVTCEIRLDLEGRDASARMEITDSPPRPEVSEWWR